MVRIVPNSMLRLYSNYNYDKNKSTSKILECPNSVFSEHHAGNLELHIKIYHKNEY